MHVKIHQDQRAIGPHRTDPGEDLRGIVGKSQVTDEDGDNDRGHSDSRTAVNIGCDVDAELAAMIKNIYRLPEETARHLQLKQLCRDYFHHYDKLMKKPSKTHAARARKACVMLKKVAHARGLELLDLYAPSRNQDRPGKFPVKHWPKTIEKLKQQEDNNESN